MKVKQTEQKEIERIKLGDTQDLVVSIVDDEKVDLRIFLNTDSYKGPDLPPLIDFLRYASPFAQTKHQAYRI
ncbi:hypothetical protein CEE35_06325 [Candidatus Aerophobetes bacterium Ae_b3b]|nr:MAG: hypothetical protein CEE35_06325 [Candidatus Aerophobetes bacterium Ae_b3b]